MIQVLVKQRDHVRIGERTSVLVISRCYTAPRVTATAGLGLPTRFVRVRTLGNTGCRVDDPRRALSVVQIDGQAPGVVKGIHLSLRDVMRAWTVAGFAADAYLGIRCVEGVRIEIVAEPHVRGMAFGAHVVPIKVAAGPVQRVAGANVLIRVQVIPTLATVNFGARVPGELQGLLAAAGRVDQVLLQRCHAEGVRDFKRFLFARRIFEGHDVATLASSECCSGVEVRNGDVGKITEDSVCVGNLHCLLVMRSLPLSELCFVTGFAGLTAGELRLRIACLGIRFLRTAGCEGCDQSNHQESA